MRKIYGVYLKKKKKTFCDQRENKVYDLCKVCKVEFLSNDCEKNHRRSECRRGIKCLNCTKYISICSKRRNQKEALAKHVCGEKNVLNVMKSHLENTSVQ